MIVKIQRPITTNAEEPKALIYDRDRTFNLMVPLEGVRELFGTYQYKLYARAEIVDGILTIEGTVPDQDW